MDCVEAHCHRLVQNFGDRLPAFCARKAVFQHFQRNAPKVQRCCPEPAQIRPTRLSPGDRDTGVGIKYFCGQCGELMASSHLLSFHRCPRPLRKSLPREDMEELDLLLSDGTCRLCGQPAGADSHACSSAFWRTFVVDITDLPEDPDHLTLIGPQQSVDDVAAQAGTIGYELLCAVAPRVPMHVVD